MQRAPSHEEKVMNNGEGEEGKGWKEGRGGERGERGGERGERRRESEIKDLEKLMFNDAEF